MPSKACTSRLRPLVFLPLLLVGAAWAACDSDDDSSAGPVSATGGAGGTQPQPDAQVDAPAGGSTGDGGGGGAAPDAGDDATVPDAGPDDSGTDASVDCPDDPQLGAGTVILSDPLDSASDPTGYRVSVHGGTFLAGTGWRTRQKDPGATTQDCNDDQLRYEIPKSVLADSSQGFYQGRIAFDVTSWHHDDTTFPQTFNLNGTEVTPHWVFFTVWEGTNSAVVHQDPFYLKMGVYDYKISLRQTLGEICPEYYDDNAYSVYDFQWNGQQTYHYELTWSPNTTVWTVDGIVAAARDFCQEFQTNLCEYTPEDLYIAVGAKPTMNVWGTVPFGIIYSNLQVFDLTAL